MLVGALLNLGSETCEIITSWLRLRLTTQTWESGSSHLTRVWTGLSPNVEPCRTVLKVRFVRFGSFAIHEEENKYVYLWGCFCYFKLPLRYILKERIGLFTLGFVTSYDTEYRLHTTLAIVGKVVTVMLWDFRSDKTPSQSILIWWVQKSTFLTRGALNLSVNLLFATLILHSTTFI